MLTYADVWWRRQILSNFAWNACKFTMEGSVTFRAEVLDDKADLDQALGQSLDQRSLRRTPGQHTRRPASL
jgi:hypothetical protein